MKQRLLSSVHNAEKLTLFFLSYVCYILSLYCKFNILCVLYYFISSIDGTKRGPFVADFDIFKEQIKLTDGGKCCLNIDTFVIIIQ